MVLPTCKTDGPRLGTLKGTFGGENPVAKSNDDQNKETTVDDNAPDVTSPESVDDSAAAAPAAAGGQQQMQQTIKVDDSAVTAGYANFCRVSSTPEELILDLGLNPNPYAAGETTVNVSQRIIMNHYTSKRLLSALSMALQRHEQAFGVLETDVRRRVRQQQ